LPPLVVQFYRESRKSHENRLYKITCTRIQTNDHLQLLNRFISGDDRNQFKFSSFITRSTLVESFIASLYGMSSPARATETRNAALQSVSAVLVESSISLHQPSSQSGINAAVRRPKKRRPVGVKTISKHVQQFIVQKLAPAPIPRPRRLKLCCGRCRKEWPSNALHWIAISKEPSDSYPLVPTYFAHHVVCLQCIPHQGRDELELNQVLTNGEKFRLKAWKEYVYVTGTRTDYDVKVASDHPRISIHCQRRELVVQKELIEIQVYEN
jgi:hypothetical protein